MNWIERAGFTERTWQHEKFRLLREIIQTVKLILGISNLGNIDLILRRKEWSQ